MSEPVEAPTLCLQGETWMTSHVNAVYIVSSLGRIWSTIKYGGKLLNETVTDDGYVKVSCGFKKFYVHRLVAEAFLPPCPVDKTTTEDDVKQLRSLRMSGTTIPTLVVMFGVSKQTVWDICARRTWGHVL